MEEEEDGGVLDGGGEVSIGCAEGDGVEVEEVGGGAESSWEEEASVGCPY